MKEMEIFLKNLPAKDLPPFIFFFFFFFFFVG